MKSLISWNAKVAMLATFAMCMAFTVLVSSAYIFTLRLIVSEPMPRNTTFLPSFGVRKDTFEVHNTTEPPTIAKLLSKLDDLTRKPEVHNGLIKLVNKTESNGTTVYIFRLENPGEIQPLNRVPRSWYYGNISSTVNSTVQDAIEKEEWVEFREKWGNSMAFVLTSSCFVFLGGLVQFFSSVYIIAHARGSSQKFLRRTTVRWMIINIIVCFVLIICITSNGAMQSDPEKSFGTPGFFQAHDSEANPNLSSSLSSEPNWLSYVISNIYNLVILLDACGLVCLIGIAACLLNNQPKHEPMMTPSASVAKTFAA